MSAVFPFERSAGKRPGNPRNSLPVLRSPCQVHHRFFSRRGFPKCKDRRGKYVAVLVQADGHRRPRDVAGRRCAETIVSGPGKVTLVAQVMLGITTRQLTFVTPNRSLDFGRNPGAFSLRFLDYAHSSSYAPPQLTSSFSIERSLAT